MFDSENYHISDKREKSKRKEDHISQEHCEKRKYATAVFLKACWVLALSLSG